MSLIPATILTGFLGSGKTTLLKRVLTEAHGQKIAVIENEFGEENIDNEILVRDSQEQIIQLNNGCVCCTIREDLRTTLADLAEKKRKGELDFDRVVIETTGLADPGPVAQTFFMDDEIAESLPARLDPDPGRRQARRPAARRPQEARRQVGFADQIFISKTDLVDEGDGRRADPPPEAHEPARAADAGGFRRGADRGGVRPARLQPQRQARHRPGVPEAEDAHGHGHDHDHDHDHEHGEHCDHPHHHRPRRRREVVRLSLPTSPSTPAKLEDFLGAIVQVYGPKMLRYKGVLNMKGTDRKVIFQGVHQLMGSDLGPEMGAGEKKRQQDGVHRHRPAARHPGAGPGAVRCLSSISRGFGRPVRRGLGATGCDATAVATIPRLNEPPAPKRRSVASGLEAHFPRDSRQGDPN